MTVDMEIVLPLLQKALAITRAHVRDVELSVLGSIQSDSPSFAENVPPKKQQITTCATICAQWGQFPRSDPSIERILNNFSMLPLNVKRPAIIFLLKHAHDENFISTADEGRYPTAELEHIAIEILLADWIESAFGSNMRIEDGEIVTLLEERIISMVGEQQHDQKSSSLFLSSFAPTAMVAKLLLTNNKRSDQQGNSLAWYWAGLALKLRALSFLRWTEVISILSGQKVDDFILNKLTPMAGSGGHFGACALALLAYDLRPKNLGGTHLPALLIQAYGNADDDVGREAILETLRAVLERSDATATQDSIRAANKVFTLAESAVKGSKELKDPALRLVAALFAKTLEDDYDLLNDKFYVKRVIRPLQGTDAKKFTRALELARILLENAKSSNIKKKLAQSLHSEVFEKPRAAMKVMFRSGSFSTEEDFCLADLARLIFLTDPTTGANKTLPMLFQEEDGSRKTLVAFLALRLILTDAAYFSLPSEAMDKLCDILTSNVNPMLDALSTSSSLVPSMYDWAQFVASHNAPSVEDSFFSNLILTPQNPAVEFKSRIFLRRHRRCERNALNDLEDRLRSYAGPVEIDASTEIRIMAIVLGIECISTGKRTLVSRPKAVNIKMPPVTFMVTPNHHPLVRASCLTTLRNISVLSFMDHMIVVREMRNHISTRSPLHLVEEMVAVLKVDSPSPSNAELAKAKELAIQMEALIIALIIVGMEILGRELALYCERRGLFVSNGSSTRGSMASLRRSLKTPSSTMTEIETIRQIALECNALVQQEIVRLLMAWSGLKIEGLSRLLATRGMSVVIALDPTKAPLESHLFDANMNVPSSNNKSEIVALLDVCRSADVSESAAVNVLSRVFQWWRSSTAHSIPTNSPATASTNTTASTAPQARKSFSVLRRFTAGHVNQGMLVLSPNTGPLPVASEETTEEDEVLMRVVRRVIESGRVLSRALSSSKPKDFRSTTSTPSHKSKVVQEQVAQEQPQQSSMESLRIVREILAVFSGASTTLNVKRRRISSRFAFDLCAVSSVFSKAVYDYIENESGQSAALVANSRLGDDAWARAERRRLFAFLRRVSGFVDMPLQISDSSTMVKNEAIVAMGLLLKIGPVSLGQVADTPDRELWSLLTRDFGLCVSYLSVHMTSLLPSYFSKAFPKETMVAATNGGSGGTTVSTAMTTSLIKAIVASVRFQLGVSIAKGIPSSSVLTDKVSRALLITVVLLCREGENNGISEDDLADLVCAGLTARVEDAPGILFEINQVMQENKRYELVDRKRRLSIICARTCPELSEDVVDLLWERRAFPLSEPWVGNLVSPLPYFEKAWVLQVPPQVWKSFSDELSCLEYLLQKARGSSQGENDQANNNNSNNNNSEEIQRGNNLMRDVASKAEWSILESLMVPLAPEVSIVMPILCDRAMDLLENLFELRDDRGTEPLVRLILSSFSYEPLLSQLLKWLRITSLEDDTLAHVLQANETNHHQAIAKGLCALDESLCRDLLGEILIRLGGGGGLDLPTTKNLVQFYCELRSLRVAPMRFLPKEEALVLASKGPLYANALQTLILASISVSGLEAILPLTLTYLADTWVCSEMDPTMVESAVHALLLKGGDAVLSTISESLCEKAFWSGMERLLRMALMQGSPTKLDEVGSICNESQTYQLLLRLCRRSSGGLSGNAAAVEVFSTNNLDSIGEDAALLLFRVAKECQQEIWMIRALSSASAGMCMASVALREVLCDPDFGAQPKLAFAAASLVSRVRQSRWGSALDMEEEVSFIERYTGPRDAEDIEIKSQQYWIHSVDAMVKGGVAGMVNKEGSFRNRKSFHVTVRNKRALESSTSPSLARSPPRDDVDRLPSLAGIGSDPRTPGVVHKKPPKRPLMDVRDALHDDFARTRLLAHAADRGIPSELVLAYERVTYIPELDKDELWQSFQRSRWWIYEDDIESPF